MKKRYRLLLWAFEFNLADIQEVREDPEALLAARMGVRIRGAGGLQYFKSLLSTAAHEQSDAFRFSDASKMVSSNMAGK